MISDECMYAESFEILAHIDKSKVMKIPLEILEFLKKEKSNTYISKIDKNDVFNPNNIDQRTINFIAWLDITYMEEENKKKELIVKCKENDICQEKIKQRMYSIDMFTKEEKNIKSISLITTCEKENIFKRIFRFLKNLF